MASSRERFFFYAVDDLSQLLLGPNPLWHYPVTETARAGWEPWLAGLEATARSSRESTYYTVPRLFFRRSEHVASFAESHNGQANPNLDPDPRHASLQPNTVETRWDTMRQGSVQFLAPIVSSQLF